MDSPSFTSQDGSLPSNPTSTNSLFSLDKRVYSNLLLNKSSYYYQNNEIDEEEKEEPVALPHGLLLNNVVNDGLGNLSRTNSPSHLTFNSTLDHRRRASTSGKATKFVFVLVGLPAVGKSTISAHLIQFLQSNPSTHSLRCSVFNAGKVRRNMSYKDLGMLTMQLANNSSDDLFSPKNIEKKERYARITLDKLLKELDSDICDVGIFDATNSRVERRRFVFEEICAYNRRPQSNFCVTPIVLQILCGDQNFIRYNVHNKTFNEDYFDKPYEYAVVDFAKRLRNYYSQFTPFSSDEFDQVTEMVSARGLNNGIFSYNLINTGLVPSKHLSNSHFPVNCSKQVSDMINLVENFVEHYARMFGYTYIERVKEFFNDNAKSSNQGNEQWKNSGCRNYLSTLGEILDEDYFIKLEELLENNKGKQ